MRDDTVPTGFRPPYPDEIPKMRTAFADAGARADGDFAVWSLGAPTPIPYREYEEAAVT